MQSHNQPVSSVEMEALKAELTEFGQHLVHLGLSTLALATSQELLESSTLSSIVGVPLSLLGLEMVELSRSLCLTGTSAKRSIARLNQTWIQLSLPWPIDIEKL